MYCDEFWRAKKESQPDYMSHFVACQLAVATQNKAFSSSELPGSRIIDEFVVNQHVISRSVDNFPSNIIL